ncbi:hypothetical protein NC796_25315 [Aliifodinibius sp. S!AR15-10]|uniref:DUF6567 family protein n=1 Tax=Aliifodinibius sp. S!AR15-10 TaxID=2950437 RepID=UPI0028581732|nr:DUF6567 family protein [Aliifodinibius sp. S!AR15-10]MDR8394490.1 hypothetical protein [Aliifodinibius sp. S!AR15-10]
MKKYLSVIAILALVLLEGCTNSGAFVATNRTSVNLQENNFTIVAANMSGEAESEYILGLSYSYGMMANTIAIARIQGSEMLYADALQNLWDRYEEEHGSIEGANLALANVRYDADIINALVYTKVKVMVRADIIEFD